MKSYLGDPPSALLYCNLQGGLYHSLPLLHNPNKSTNMAGNLDTPDAYLRTWHNIVESFESFLCLTSLKLNNFNKASQLTRRKTFNSFKIYYFLNL